MQAAVIEVKFRVRISVAEVKQWIRGADIRHYVLEAKVRQCIFEMEVIK